MFIPRTKSRIQVEMTGKEKTLRPVSIATLPLSFTGYTFYVAEKLDLFRQYGLDARFTLVSTGKEALMALQNGEVDFAVSSETPFMHAVMRGAEIQAVATTITAQGHLGVVARRDLGVGDVQDLRGRKVGVTLGSNGEYFLDLALLLGGIARDTVQRVHMKPEDMVPALQSGRVAAVATWNPPKAVALKALGEEGVEFDAKGLYAPLFLVSSRKAYLAANADVAEALIDVLAAAGASIQEDPMAAHAIVAERTGVDPALLQHLTASYVFHLSLDQTLLMTLENQARWAMERGLLPEREMPNFLHHVSTAAMEKKQPEHVSIIR